MPQTQPNTVVIAPDSFKGTATAADVATALSTGWRSVRPDDHIRLLPMADGGEGSLSAFETAIPDAHRMEIMVQGPDGSPVETYWVLLPDGTGVVELAHSSGITLLGPLQPHDAHTYGFGQVIADALDHQVARLLLAIGGSASTDGGVPALAALGAVFLDADGAPVRPGNRGLHDVASVDLSGLRPLPPGGARILSDVTHPLLGPLGAAAVFGPQKGADQTQVVELEAGLTRLARYLPGNPDKPGAGAAGGVGFGLLAWGAELEPGSMAVGEALGLPQAVAEASVVITGEGRFDEQSAAGKVPDYLLQLSTAAGVPAMLVAGAIQAEPRGFVAVQSLSDLAGSADAAIDETLRWLREAGARLAATNFF